MKRAILFGIAVSLLAISATHILMGNVTMSRGASIVVGVIVGVIGIFVTRAARRSKPANWPVTILGWIIGFFAITVVGLGVLETARVASLIAPNFH